MRGVIYGRAHIDSNYWNSFTAIISLANLLLVEICDFSLPFKTFRYTWGREKLLSMQHTDLSDVSHPGCFLVTLNLGQGVTLPPFLDLFSHVVAFFYLLRYPKQMWPKNLTPLHQFKYSICCNIGPLVWRVLPRFVRLIWLVIGKISAAQICNSIHICKLDTRIKVFSKTAFHSYIRIKKIKHLFLFLKNLFI